MNIFVTDPSPTISAQVLPDKHVVKMPLESCQMLSIIFSHWYHNWGDDLLKKKDGVPYKTSKGAFRNHPCTQWAAASMPNLAWLIEHGIALSNEYTHRYGKIHSCAAPLHESREIFNARSKTDVSCYPLVKSLPEQCPMSTNITQGLTLLLLTKLTLPPNLGLHLIIFVTHPENRIGYD